MPIQLNKQVRDRALGAAHSGNVDQGPWTAPTKRGKSNCIGRETDQIGKVDEWKYPVFTTGGRLSSKGAASALAYAESDAPGLVEALRAISTAIHGKPAIAAAAEGVSLLHLRLTGEGEDVRPAGMPEIDEAGNPIFYRKMLVAKCRPYVHRADGTKFEIKPDEVDEWVKNYLSLSAAGFKPFVPGEHRTKFNARDNHGFIVGLDRDGDKVYATMALHGKEALDIAAKNSRSIYVVRNARDDRGNIHPGESLHHIALTPNPALGHLGDMVKLAASADGTAQFDVPLYELSEQPASSASSGQPTEQTHETMLAASTQEPQMAQMLTQAHLDRVKAAMKKNKMDPASATMDNGIDHACNCAEGNPMCLSADDMRAAREITGKSDLIEADAPMVILKKALSLSADVRAITVERDNAKTDATTASQKVLELSSERPNPDALTRAMYSDNMAAKRESAIAKGGFSEAFAQKIDELIMDADGSPNVLALTACSKKKKPFGFLIWDALASLSDDGVRAGLRLNRDAVPLPPALSGDMDHSTGGKMTAQRRKELNLDPASAAK